MPENMCFYMCETQYFSAQLEAGGNIVFNFHSLYHGNKSIPLLNFLITR